MLRKDVREAIRRLWPDGVVKWNADYEDSWFLKLRPKLARALKGLKRARLRVERPDECEPSRSYYAYFVVPDGVAFEFTSRLEDYVDGKIEMVHGDGQTGWYVAVSLLAPFAVITLAERIVYDNGDVVRPELEWHLGTMEGDPIDPEQHFREMVAEEAFSDLTAVRREIAEALEKHGVSVLPPEEWKKRAPALRLGDGVSAQQPPRVLDALFFEEA